MEYELLLGEPAIVMFGLLGHSGDNEWSYVSMRSAVELQEAVTVALSRDDTSLPTVATIFLFEQIELAVVVVVVIAGTWQLLADLAVFICSWSESNKSARNSWQSCCESFNNKKNNIS